MHGGGVDGRGGVWVVGEDLLQVFVPYTLESYFEFVSRLGHPRQVIPELVVEWSCVRPQPYQPAALSTRYERPAAYQPYQPLSAPISPYQHYQQH